MKVTDTAHAWGVNCRRIGLMAISLFVTISLGLPSPAAANSGFDISADRSSVPLGTPAVISVTIRPGDQSDVDNLCYAFGVPAAFTILDAEVTARPEGSNWAAALQAGSLEVRSNGESEIEDPERLIVAITVHGNTPGSYTWTIGGYDKNVCQTGALKDERSMGMAITGAPTPSPSPSPPPTPAPTPRPTPSSPPAQPPSATPVPQGTVQASPTPSPAQPSPGADEGGQSATGPDLLDDDSQGGAAGPAATGSPQLVTVPLGDGRDDAANLEAQLASGVLTAMALLDNPYEWFVPGATLGVPAFVILVVLGLQLVGGFIAAPAVRRLTDEDRPRRRPLRPGWLGPPPA